MDNDIIVFCGGKCGSSTIANTFIRDGLKVLHCHSNEDYLTNENIVNETKIKDIKKLIISQTKSKVFIIDSYRDPIERLISSFFQNISYHIGDNYNMYDLIVLYHFIFNNRLIEDYHPLDEFFPELFFISDFNGKYIKIDNGNLTFIKLRFKDINLWNEYLSEIIGRDVHIVDDNLSINKSYYEFYEKFKREIVIPRTMLHWAINSKYFCKYNSPEERLKYYNKWLPRTIDDKDFNDLLYKANFTNISNNFDIEIYKEKNQDLKDMNEIELKYHYEIYGHKEKRIHRIYKIEIENINDIQIFYGNDDIKINVTDKIKSLIDRDSDNKSIKITSNYNDLFDDPIPNLPKKLIINDGSITYSFNENQPLVLLF